MGNPKLQLQGDVMTELENGASIPPPEELEDVEYDKVMADHKPEGSNPSEEPGSGGERRL